MTTEKFILIGGYILSCVIDVSMIIEMGFMMNDELYSIRTVSSDCVLGWYLLFQSFYSPTKTALGQGN